MEIDVGRAIGGKYELVRLLGRGSMGEVWVAHHRTLGQNVAVKVLTRAAEAEALEDGATAVARFRFEAQVAARLSRKTRHIVRVTDHGEEEGLPYLVMELLEGETLEARLARDARLPLEVVTELAGQIGRALGQAHGEGVFHRDLKPANVFLARDEEGKLLVKLLDFGIARATHVHRAGPSAFATARGVVFGTPSYMSPEQARGSSKLDHRCDLWALATILYEALSGDLPLEGTDTDQLMENLCAGRIRPLRWAALSQGTSTGETEAPFPVDVLAPFFERAFAQEIALRFQTSAELVQALEAASATRSLPGSATPPSEEDSPPVESTPGSVLDPNLGPARNRNRIRAAVLAGVALLGVLTVAGVAWRGLPPKPSAVAAAPVVPAAASSGRSPTEAFPVVAAAPPSASESVAAAPAVPVSALPRAQSTPAPAPAPIRSAATGRSARPSGRPPEPLPNPASPSPVPASQPPPKAFDKSEVF
jgi:serine/threonine-protein kinase